LVEIAAYHAAMGCFFSSAPAKYASIANGENLLLRKVTHDYAVGGYENFDSTEGGWFTVHERGEKLTDEPWLYQSDGVSIRVQKSRRLVELDTNFGKRAVSVTIKSRDGRSQERGIGAQARLEVSSDSVGVNFESQIKDALSDGSGEVAFSFSVPCLALRLVDAGKYAERCITEVILGGKVDGVAILSGGRERGASLQADVGVSSDGAPSIGVGGGARYVQGEQTFHFNLVRFGGPDLDTTMQGETCAYVMKKLEVWKKRLFAQPSLWQVLFVKASRPESCLSGKRHLSEDGPRIPVSVEDPAPEPEPLPVSSQDPPAVVYKKLYDPTLKMSPEESIECLLAAIHYGSSQTSEAKGKELVSIIGNTGAGKSSFVNYLHGCTMEYVKQSVHRKVVQVDPCSPYPEMMKIGHGNKSATFIPVVKAAKNRLPWCPVRIC